VLERGWILVAMKLCKVTMFHDPILVPDDEVPVLQGQGLLIAVLDSEGDNAATATSNHKADNRTANDEHSQEQDPDQSQE
jgi:hypothetical protein